ncbi:putative Cuticular protein [Daphnia magna]|uniref:Putative Cuticular protein n=1 Tax=Daphnia magna TaxID=35525 RepID=A0A164TTR7_9CRUS|nr:putative Cuticular protein [Daphnia magna]
MKFFLLATLFTIAAADSYRAAEHAPKYVAPSYVPPKYETATYAEVNYETAEPYEFGYVVKDTESYADFDHSEKRDGKVTTGTYRVQLPDGRVQIVTYKADSYGYTADVKFVGEAKYPEYVQSKYNSYSVPAYKAPAAPVYSAPAYKAPAPVKPAPQYKASTTPAPVYSKPVYKTPAPVYPTPAYEAPKYKATTTTAAPAYDVPTYIAPTYPSAPVY